jgi:predicted nucleotidyltransferase
MMLDLLSSRPKLRLLRYLTTHEGLHTGRALARAAGVEAKRAAEALRELVDAGLIDRRRAGRAFLYSLNRDNYTVGEILVPAFVNERDWLQRLGRELRHFIPGIDSVILYGSWSKGKAQPRSDVDLLLVTRENIGKNQAVRLRARADEIRPQMSERYGRSVSLLILGPDELRLGLRKRDRFIREILEGGQVLAGSTLAEVVGHG